MDILGMLGGGNPSDLLSDSKKLEAILPMLEGLADTYKLQNEHAVVAMVAFEDGRPVLRVVATAIITVEIDGVKKQAPVISRNILDPQGKALKFDLLELLAANNTNG